MKVTKFFGLWILSVLCVLSCTDEEQGTGNIVPNVATAPVKLSLDATPMRELLVRPVPVAIIRWTWCWARKQGKRQTLPEPLPVR